ncbi:MAG: hypothetical protein ACODAB_01300 [Gemmatimonadota bacterium]
MLRPTDRHAAVMREVISRVPYARGNLIHDLHTAVLMREHGVGSIRTRDSDFHRFEFVEVVDPVA